MSRPPEPVLTFGADISLVRNDFRLVPAALIMWLGCLGGILLGSWISLLIGITAVVVSVVTYLIIRRKSPLWTVSLLVLMMCGVILCWPITVQFHKFEHDELTKLSAYGGVVAVTASIDSRPKPVHTTGYADQQAGARLVLVSATVSAVYKENENINSSAHVTLIAPAESWQSLLPQQQVGLVGELAPSGRSDMTAATVYVRGPPAQVTEPPWWQSVAANLRAGLTTAAGVLGDDEAGLLPGLVLGNTDGLSARVTQEFRDAGMSHLLAVSGSNVMIICGAVLLILRFFRAGPRFSVAAAGLALLSFVVIVGFEPSVLRAGVMAGVGLLALAMGRISSALPALAVAVIVLVIADPALAVSYGFALSVLATAGLVLYATRWSQLVSRRGIPLGLSAMLVVPVVAFIATAPVLAGMTGKISVLSVFANALAVPAVAPVTVIGVIATLMSVWFPDIAEKTLELIEPAASWLITVARKTSEIPGAVWVIPGGWWGAFLVVLVVFGVCLLWRKPRLRVVLAVVICMALIVPPWRQAIVPWPPRGWVMVACDVGQGDAIVLATAEPGRAIVIDSGPELGPVDACLDRLDISRIPLLILSHLHVDHIGGASSIFDNRSVGAIAVSAGRVPSWAWENVSRLARQHGVPIVELNQGMTLDWSGVSLHILGPRYIPLNRNENQDGTDVNNTSLVVRADTTAARILLTGDIELAAQSDLLTAADAIQADILKVPHHGSRYSLPIFFDAVRPRIALISVGRDNRYGHPSNVTVDRLRTAGALVARTDQGGDTAVIADTSRLAIARYDDHG